MTAAQQQRYRQWMNRQGGASSGIKHQQTASLDAVMRDTANATAWSASSTPNRVMSPGKHCFITFATISHMISSQWII